jgi:hypothetical protein
MGVYGMSGVVTNVSVTLLGLSHTFPDDLDMLLRAPDSVHNLAFWSDAGAGTDLLNADITISDSGAVALPDGSPLTSGVYRPADYGAIEPAADYSILSGSITHAGPNGGGTFANAFSGANPNGEWSLTIVDDDLTQDTGSSMASS